MPLKGLATGIGSLPYAQADKALDLIFKYCPGIPFWPQLPKRDNREGMVAQFSERIPCIRYTPEGIIFNGQQKEEELEVFYDRIISQDLEYFKISQNYAFGLYEFYQRLKNTLPEDLKLINSIKCHVTGPFTFAASINDESGVSLLHDQVFMQVILKAITMKALWQISMFNKFDRKIIMFFDEPYLSGFGSAFTPLNRDQVIAGLTELVSPVKSQGVLTGVHCCGNTDWTILTDVTGIDIINFDAFSFFERLALYAVNLKAFLKRGGMLCWGIVPTQEFNQQVTPELLIQRIKAGVDILVKKGIDRELVTENLFLSPACGLGTLDVSKAESIFKTLSATAGFLVKYL